MRQKQMSQVRCPRCKGPQAKRGPHSIYWCEKCRAQFDDDPNEGGDYDDQDPSARLERDELRAEKRRAIRDRAIRRSA